MRRAFRAPVTIPPAVRLARAVRPLPERAQAALRDVAERDDLPLVAGSWRDDGAGCLVANVLAADLAADEPGTLDVRMLRRFPELSSRDLNRLIVAWDEAAAEARADADAELRSLLQTALALAEEPAPAGR